MAFTSAVPPLLGASPVFEFTYLNFVPVTAPESAPKETSAWVRLNLNHEPSGATEETVHVPLNKPPPLEVPETVTTQPGTMVFAQPIVATFDVSCEVVTMQFEALVIWLFVLYPATPTPEIFTTAGLVKLGSRLAAAVTSTVEPLS